MKMIRVFIFLPSASGGIRHISEPHVSLDFYDSIHHHPYLQDENTKNVIIVDDFDDEKQTELEDTFLELEDPFEQPCPSVETHGVQLDFPFVFDGGHKCCKTDLNGSGQPLKVTSKTCSNDNFIPRAEGKCPYTYPYLYQDGLMCCEVNQDANSAPLKKSSTSCYQNLSISPFVCQNGQSEGGTFWRDIDGHTCRHYEENIARCSFYSLEQLGSQSTALDVCCACGGGKHLYDPIDLPDPQTLEKLIMTKKNKAYYTDGTTWQHICEKDEDCGIGHICWATTKTCFVGDRQPCTDYTYEEECTGDYRCVFQRACYNKGSGLAWWAYFLIILILLLAIMICIVLYLGKKKKRQTVSFEYHCFHSSCAGKGIRLAPQQDSIGPANTWRCTLHDHFCKECDNQGSRLICTDTDKAEDIYTKGHFRCTEHDIYCEVPHCSNISTTISDIRKLHNGSEEALRIAALPPGRRCNVHDIICYIHDCGNEGTRRGGPDELVVCTEHDIWCHAALCGEPVDRKIPNVGNTCTEHDMFCIGDRCAKLGFRTLADGDRVCIECDNLCQIDPIGSCDNPSAIRCGEVRFCLIHAEEGHASTDHYHFHPPPEMAIVTPFEKIGASERATVASRGSVSIPFDSTTVSSRESASIPSEGARESAIPSVPIAEIKNAAQSIPLSDIVSGVLDDKRSVPPSEIKSAVLDDKRYIPPSDIPSAILAGRISVPPSENTKIDMLVATLDPAIKRSLAAEPENFVTTSSTSSEDISRRTSKTQSIEETGTLAEEPKETRSSVESRPSRTVQNILRTPAHKSQTPMSTLRSPTNVSTPGTRARRLSHPLLQNEPDSDVNRETDSDN